MALTSRVWSSVRSWVYAPASSPSPSPSPSPSSLPTIAMVINGPCTFGHRAGQFPCHCKEGTYVTNTDLSLAHCDSCGHLMSIHQDYTHNSAIQNPLLIQQPLSTAGPTQIDWFDNMSRREDTVAKLLDLVLRRRVVQIRGTPMSGKTILSKLLYNHIQLTAPNLTPVHIIYRNPTQANLVSNPACQNYGPWLRTLSEFQLPTDFLSRNDVVVIIDEAQLSYTCIDFWIGCVKVQAEASQDKGPYLVLFSSFGSADSIALDIEGSAPITLEQNQRVSLTPQPNSGHKISLCFTEAELDDVCGRIAKGRFQYDEDLVKYVFRLTNGHPALCLGLLESVIEQAAVRPLVKAGQVICYKHVADFFNLESTLFGCVRARARRSLPPEEMLKNDLELLSALKETIINGGKIESGNLDNVPGLMTAYKKGYLQAEMIKEGVIVYSFPSKLHMRYCASLILPDSSDGVPFTAVKELCFAAISHFGPRQLEDHVRKAPHLAMKWEGSEQAQPPEAQYADELYRCLHLVTGGKCSVHSEFSYTKSGRLDFFLKGKSWGIEVLREGDRLEEHLDRFKEKGKYGSWNLMKDWITLDFRRSEPDPKTKCNDLHLFIVIFAPKNESYRIWDSGHNVVVPHTQLFYSSPS